MAGLPIRKTDSYVAVDSQGNVKHRFTGGKSAMKRLSALCYMKGDIARKGTRNSLTLYKVNSNGTRGVASGRCRKNKDGVVVCKLISFVGPAERDGTRRLQDARLRRVNPCEGVGRRSLSGTRQRKRRRRR